jgi:hypothetical protein
MSFLRRGLPLRSEGSRRFGDARQLRVSVFSPGDKHDNLASTCDP